MTNRREFLQRLASTATVLALDPLRGVKVEGETWTNQRLGLSVTKPLAWEYSSIADFAALRERQVLEEAWHEAEPHPMKDPENLPVLLIENPIYRDGEFAPSVVLYDEPLYGGHPEGETAAHWFLLRRLGTVYRGVRVLEAPSVRRLQGANATISRCRYQHVLDDGATYELLVRTVLVFRPPRVHTYYLVDAAEGPHIPDAVFEAFIDSIDYREGPNLSVNA